MILRYAFVVPAAALLLVVLAFPMAGSLAAGIPHYGGILSDPTLAQSALNTGAFALVSVSLEMALGLLFALLLDRTFRLRGLARAVALLPWALPTAVMAMSWRWIFHDTCGVANDLLVQLGLMDEGIAWLGRPGTAFAALVAADVWKTTPFVTIILLAGLQAIPRDLHEAMSLDGAGPLQRFRLVTLPLLRPSIAVALVFRLIQAIGIFDLVQVMTDGGPADSTRTVALYLYDVLIRYDMPGYGAAVTGAAVAATLLITLGLGALARGRVRA